MFRIQIVNATSCVLKWENFDTKNIQSSL
jgi:hypothetical protein